MARKYDVNAGLRNHAVRVGLERGIYEFLMDYAMNLGTSLSAAARRLIILGARCESEHGHVSMPMSFEEIMRPKSDIDFLLEEEI